MVDLLYSGGSFSLSAPDPHRKRTVSGRSAIGADGPGVELGDMRAPLFGPNDSPSAASLVSCHHTGGTVHVLIILSEFAFFFWLLLDGLVFCLAQGEGEAIQFPQNWEKGGCERKKFTVLLLLLDWVEWMPN